MRTLSRPIGLGLAARGDVEDVVRWAREARDGGLDSIWIHDSYFERDAVSFSTAVASALAADGEDDGEAGFRVALGAVNPFTRHPVVLAMTGSALDEILPGRIVMGLGTGLPLRLKQMGIPYEPEAAVERVSQAMDQLRALWAGERLPSATPGLPPIQPMFPPTHRIPLIVAAYRREFVTLAGQKADGYLARPAESIPSLRGILERLRAAATEAGRDPADIETAGYLLSLVDETRREALNRAKREPFVIYMMSVLSDVSLRRAGFEADLRDRIAAAWRAEDYTTAGNLIPDELLDAFMLCGTREDVAAKAMAFHAEAGLGLPLLQPVLQEDHQVDELIAAAALYAALPAPAESRAVERPETAVGLADDRQLGAGSVVRRRVGATWEVLRPFAYTASVIPVLAGAALAAVDGLFAWAPFVAALLGGMLIHSGTNIVNEIYDVRQGIDTITSPARQPRHRQGPADRAWSVRPRLRGVRAGDPHRPVPGCAARPGDHRSRPDRPGRWLLLHGPAVPVQVPRARRAARLRPDGPADGRRLVLRDHRCLVGDRAGPVDPGRLSRGGDSPRQRVARHQRGHPGGHRDPVLAGRPGMGSLLVRGRSSWPPTSASAWRWPSR